MFQGRQGEIFMDQLFRIFDKDGDGSIDFKVLSVLLYYISKKYCPNLYNNLLYKMG